MLWKLTIALVIIVSVAGVLYLSGVNKAQLTETLKYVERSASSSGPAPAMRHEVALPIKPKAHWDGLVAIDPAERTAIGLQLAKVEAQARPIKLELTGRTAYDPDTLTKIRPRFDTLVERVHASLGQKVKKGDPLVDLYSTELAKAKSDLQSKFVQWQHDMRLFDLRKKLVETGAISQQLWVDTQNDEKKSRLDYLLAIDTLKVYKVPPEDIESLLIPLKDSSANPKQFGDIEEKAKMTLRAPADGIVIEREAVPQNFYDTSSVLMVIAPLDHLWVLLNVYELDQDKVRKGQTMEIQFPFLDQKIKGTVQYVANEVSKETRAIRIRATIPNPDTRLKSDMVLKAMLDIPPLPGQTIIPRLAMVSTNGSEYVFVRKPRDPKAKPGDPDKFERRRIVVAQEDVDQVVVSRGLRPDEEVVSNGSLIIAQLFEDRHMVETGLPQQ
jgi:membrane fusion protein, heavy metal efflux system